jgi:UDP-N-acetylmuramoyl-tripeptide--D-alanyl-D-alanine ligase
MIQIITLLVTLAFLGSWVRVYALDCLRALHILQLEEYQTARYLRWQAANPRALVDLPASLGAAIAVVGLGLLPAPVALLGPFVGGAAGVVVSLRRKPAEAKKPLVLTARARRLLIGWIVCVCLVVGGVALAVTSGQATSASALPLGLALGYLAASVLIWPLMALANLLLFPVEAGFRAYYLRSARQTLNRLHPTVIGVAGSYGKTSTKTILAQILSTAYPTLATPRSFNTPMGLCRVIREQLQPEHRFFIAELGAYQRGEIRQLCQLVRPRIGILTAVGPEHLERFGSLANVIEGEFELLAALPADGIAIVNGDDETCRALAGRLKGKALLAGGPPHPDRVLWADEVSLTSAGLGFTLCHRDGRQAAVVTRLLGRPNVANVLMAAVAALEAGLAFEQLPAAIAALTPVEHRLQLVPNSNGVVVIDDTYNSNPRGAAAALETLAAFAGGRRYLVTPGMVELADLQDAAHREFGRQAAGVCDAVILVGPRRTRAIAEGLASAGYRDDRLIVARDLNEATEQLREILRPGDAVLFENDLPDNYAE